MSHGGSPATNALQLLLEIEGWPRGGRQLPESPSCLVRPLSLDPLVEVGEGERLEGATAFALRSGHPVVVDQRVEAVFAAVPDVPDEGPVVEELAVVPGRNDLGASPPVISVAWNWSRQAGPRSVVADHWSP